MTLVRRNAAWLPDVFNDLFDADVMPAQRNMNVTAPAINVKESEKEYTVEVAAPGLTKEDFDVQINHDGDLNIKVESKHAEAEEKGKEVYLRREFSTYTKYEQTLILPEDVEREKISAKVDCGVLTIHLPKPEPKPEPKLGRKVTID